MVAAAFQRLDTSLDDLDRRVAAGESLSTLYRDVLRVAARIHGEWVRIHPFVDHNGSTARLLCLAVGLRYGIPFKLPGKPRSELMADGLLPDYEQAADNQMLGDDTLMVRVLHRLVQQP
jgi:fido (protein-threonine AMPylation protein)